MVKLAQLDDPTVNIHGKDLAITVAQRGLNIVSCACSDDQSCVTGMIDLKRDIIHISKKTQSL
jgi:hypothetical protein